MSGLLTLALIVGGGVALILAALRIWCGLDRLATEREWRQLRAAAAGGDRIYEPSLVAGLPDAVQRYFNAVIRPGARLHPAIEIEMQGRIGMGTNLRPGYADVTAREILAAPQGFVWQMRTTKGNTRLSGSDTGRWTRFWLAGVLPVARAGDTPDQRRSSFGRTIAEATFWSPAALLPGPGVEWKETGTDAIRVTVAGEALSQSVDLLLDDTGLPQQVSLERWSDANDEDRFQLQPFGGYLSEWQDFEGFRLPTHVEAGNFFGTDAFFPFYIVDVTRFRFPDGEA